MSTTRTLGWMLVVSGLCWGCAEADNLFVRHLFRPLDMAVVCLDADGQGAPPSDCADGAGTLVGFVANAERPGLSWLNLRTGEFKDLNAFIPSYNPVDVGHRAVSIVGLADGSAVITANFADRSLTRLQTATLDRDDHALSDRPVHLIQVADALVVALHPDDAGVNGRLLRLPLTSFGQEDGTAESLSLPGWPSDLVVNGTGESLYVSYVDRAFVSRVDLTTWTEVVSDRAGLADACRDDLDNNGDGLVDQADFGCRWGTEEYTAPDNFTEPDSVDLTGGVGSLPQCMNEVDDNGDGLTDFPDDPLCASWTDSVESASPPLLSRQALTPDGAFLYVTNARDATVVVIDTATMTRVDVNAEQLPGANALLRRLGIEDIQLQSYESPLDVEILPVSASLEDGSDGTQWLAYITSATGKIILLDVTEPDGSFVHRFRDGDSSAETVPFPPHLFEGDEEVELGGGRRKDYPSFGEYVANKILSGPEENAKSHYGIQVLGEPRIARNEIWDITHQAVLLKRTVPLGQLNLSSDALVFETVEDVYCGAGVEVGDQLVLEAPSDLVCEGPSFQSVAFTISAVTSSTLTLEPGTGAVFEAAVGEEVSPAGTAVSDDVLGCLNSAMGYRVRAPKGTYAVSGTVSGFMHPWVDDGNGACVKDGSLEDRFTKGRMQEWVLKDGESIPLCPLTDDLVDDYFEHPEGLESFENHVFRVRMIPGCQDSEEPGEYVLTTTPVDTRWRFLLDSAFEIEALGSLGTPRRLQWHPTEQRVFVVDSGLERVVSITPSSEKVSRTDYY